MEKNIMMIDILLMGFNVHNRAKGHNNMAFC